MLSSLACLLICIGIFTLSAFVLDWVEKGFHEHTSHQTFEFVSTNILRVIQIDTAGEVLSRVSESVQDLDPIQFTNMLEPVSPSGSYFSLYNVKNKDREKYEAFVSDLFNRTIRIVEFDTNEKSPYRPEYWVTYLHSGTGNRSVDFLSLPALAVVVNRTLEYRELSFSRPSLSALGELGFVKTFPSFPIDSWGGQAMIGSFITFENLFETNIQLSEFTRTGNDREIRMSFISSGVEFVAYETCADAKESDGVFNEIFRIDQETFVKIVGWEKIIGLGDELFVMVVLCGIIIGGILAVFEHKRSSLLSSNKQQTEKAECASREKSQFVSNISHEIRTPLNGIIGMTDIIERSSLNLESQYCIDIIRSCGSNLLHIVNNILDMSAIESGVIEISLKEVFVKTLLLDVFSGAWSTMSTKSSSIVGETSISFSATVPDQAITTDPVRVNQVVTNILTNAYKYTKEGSVSMFVTFSEHPTDDKSLLKISVKDTGVGISEEDQKNLFKVFTRFDRERQIEGTGIGLSISKGIAKKLGGDITVVSRVGEGSVFTFSIPVIGSINTQGTFFHKEYTKETFMNPSPRKQTVPKENYTITPGTKILIVDDVRLNRSIIERMLLGHECVVETATTGLEAVEKCLQKRYDIILIDNVMPVMGGQEATLSIRNKGLNTDTKIIFVTADVLKTSVNSYLKSGADGFIPKPFRKNDLFRKLEEISQSISVNVRD